jgi:hypothetical protein
LNILRFVLNRPWCRCAETPHLTRCGGTPAFCFSVLVPRHPPQPFPLLHSLQPFIASKTTSTQSNNPIFQLQPVYPRVHDFQLLSTPPAPLSALTRGQARQAGPWANCGVVTYLVLQRVEKGERIWKSDQVREFCHWISIPQIHRVIEPLIILEKCLSSSHLP